MRDLFPNHYTPTEEQFTTLWKDALMAVDTNVILNLYRYTEPVANDLFTVLEKLKDRLWLPHQAAFEYQQNRLVVIAEQAKKINDARKISGKVITAANAAIEELELRRKHFFISPDRFITSIRAATEEFENELNGLAAQQGDTPTDDKLRNRIDALFKDRIGPRPADQKALDDIYKSGTERFAKKRPPGFLDDKEKDKADPHWFDGLRFERKYGDLILWEELIAHTKSIGAKHVIFITDEQDEDWWWIVNKQTIGPRRELTEEIRDRAGVTFFHMYSSVMFLEYAKKNLHASVADQSIEQVRAVVKQQFDIDAGRDALKRAREFIQEVKAGTGTKAELAVFEWLKESFPEAKIRINHGFPDFILTMDDGDTRGFEVKAVLTRSDALPYSDEITYDMMMRKSHVVLKDVTLVFVVPDDETAEYIRHQASTKQLMFSFIIGVIDAEGRFSTPDSPIFDWEIIEG